MGDGRRELEEFSETSICTWELIVCIHLFSSLFLNVQSFQIQFAYLLSLFASHITKSHIFSGVYSVQKLQVRLVFYLDFS